MLDLKALIGIIQHRRWIFIGAAAMTLFASVAIIAALPSTYTSSAKILVEREGLFGAEGSGQLVDNVNQRLHAITTRLLSRDTITDVLRTHGLIEPDSDPEAVEAAAVGFAEEVIIGFDNVAVVNPYTGKAGMYSQGLIVSYDHRDPETAHGVVTDLTERVMRAHRGEDSEAVAHRREFLEAEYAAAGSELLDARSAVADFKRDNALFLPEVHTIAMRRYEELQLQAQRADDNISRLRRELAGIAGELATSSADAFVLTADGRRILGVDEEIRVLEAEVAKARSRYSADHPQRRALEAELNSLLDHRSSAGTGGLEADIQALQQRLITLTQRYSDTHPDVQRARQELSGLQQRLERSGRVADRDRLSNASNPEYNRLLIREQSLRDELGREQRRQQAVEADIGSVQNQLAEMPGVEQQLATLDQQETLAERKHREIEDELERLNLESGMRQAQLLDHLVLVEAPRVPLSPSGPNKMLMMPVALFFSLLVGLLAAALFHLIKDHILGAEDVAHIIDVPVYAAPKFS